MEIIKPSPITATELRDVLGVAKPTISKIIKDTGAQYLDEPRRKNKRLPPSEVRKILIERGYKYPKPAHIITFMMQKGGVGKTTSCFWLGLKFVSYGARVLLIDSDPQGNLTQTFGFNRVEKEEIISKDTPILTDLYDPKGKLKIQDIVINVTDYLSLIPSTPVNSTLERRINEQYKNPALAVSEKIKPLLNSYDYVLIDCGPTLNTTNASMILAANEVIIPMDPDDYSNIGLEQTLSEIKTLESQFSRKVTTNIVFTKYDDREKISKKYLGHLASVHDDSLYDSYIRTNSDIKNVKEGLINLFEIPKNNAAEDYSMLAREIMGLDVVSLKK